MAALRNRGATYIIDKDISIDEIKEAVCRVLNQSRPRKKIYNGLNIIAQEFREIMGWSDLDKFMINVDWQHANSYIESSLIGSKKITIDFGNMDKDIIIQKITEFMNNANSLGYSSNAFSFKFVDKKKENKFIEVVRGVKSLKFNALLAVAERKNIYTSQELFLTFEECRNLNLQFKYDLRNYE